MVPTEEREKEHTRPALLRTNKKVSDLDIEAIMDNEVVKPEDLWQLDRSGENHHSFVVSAEDMSVVRSSTG